MTIEFKAELVSLLDRPDIGLSPAELKAKYELLDPGEHWASHPVYPIGDWRHDVMEGNTLQSYWEWVVSSVESALEDGVYDAEK